VIKAAMHKLSADGVGRKIGYVTLYDAPGGLALDVQVQGLTPGPHGFHIHEFGNVEPKDGKPGGAAGQHFDPERTDKHLGPYRNGHLGDLPFVTADADGKVDQVVVAPRLLLEEVEGLALIIHSGGDNYSDKPLPNGGGKSRVLGGIITNDCPYCKKKRNQMLLGAAALAAGAYAWKNR
jgi:Cu-Zn family superoxide dismutase